MELGKGKRVLLLPRAGRAHSGSKSRSAMCSCQSSHPAADEAIWSRFVFKSSPFDPQNYSQGIKSEVCSLAPAGAAGMRVQLPRGAH